MRFFDAIGQDVRFALRTFRRSPAYAVGAALTLALGIGATTAVFSIFDVLVLRGVPYGDATQLYMAIERNAKGGMRTPSYVTFRDWAADSSVWRGTIEGMTYIRGRPTWVDHTDGAERVLVGHASPGFFPLMKTRPHLGRTFRPEEELAGGERVVVLSFDAWRRYYGGDAGIIDRIITVEGDPTRVIGVMPRAFAYPQWSPSRAGSNSMWMPIAHVEGKDAGLAQRNDHADSRVVIRVRAGTDSARAAASIALMASRLAVAYPTESKDWVHAELFSVRDGVLGSVTQLVRTLAGAVALVLLLACVNVANLSFVRGTTRAREFAVRAALGASRARVVRQLLTESVMIGAASAAGGMFLASAILSATRSLGANQLIGAEHLGVNAGMLVFATVVSVLTAITSAILPAFRATRSAPARAVRSGAQSAIGGRSDARVRGALVVAQLALAVVLLVGTGLLVRSFQRVSAAPLGFDPNGLVQTAISPPDRYAKAEDALVLYQTLLERVRAIPGVTDAAFTNNGRITTAIVPEGGELRSDVGSSIAPRYHTVSDGYLATMRMDMAAGRWLSEADMRTRDQFVINETLARQLFPNQTAIGKRVTARRASRLRPNFGQPVNGTIVGIARDVPRQTRDGPTPPEIFVPFTLETWTWGSLFIRTTDVARAIPLVREAIRDVDPAIPESRASAGFDGVGAVRDRLSDGLAQRRLVLSAIGAFSLSALVLAAIGLYSVMSYGVSQRTREVGVRIALGATHGSILRLVLGEGTRLAVLGVVIGVAGALGATRLIRAMLFGTTTTDFPTYAFTAVVLLLAAACASYFPARRAARLSPIEAIRSPDS